MVSEKQSRRLDRRDKKQGERNMRRIAKHSDLYMSCGILCHKPDDDNEPLSPEEMGRIKARLAEIFGEDD